MSSDADAGVSRRDVSRISIIIPVLDQWEQLLGCLESIGAQECSESSEILVVDNGSREPPPHRVRERCTAVLTCEESGSYAARNKGVEAAEGELIAFTDADCVTDPLWLQAGIDCLGRNGAPDIVAGRISVYPRDNVPTDVERYDIAYGIRQESFVRRGFGATANLFVRRELLERNGQFREDLYSGGDKEWCHRALRQGARIVYCEEALVWHPARRDFSEIRRKTRRLVGGRWRRRGWRRYLVLVGLVLPPLHPIVAAIAPTRRGIRERLAFIRVSMFIWMVKAAETIRLISGGSVERR